jgi:hypothetical protein
MCPVHQTQRAIDLNRLPRPQGARSYREHAAWLWFPSPNPLAILDVWIIKHQPAHQTRCCGAQLLGQPALVPGGRSAAAQYAPLEPTQRGRQWRWRPMRSARCADAKRGSSKKASCVVFGADQEWTRLSRILDCRRAADPGSGSTKVGRQLEFSSSAQPIGPRGILCLGID